jgi:hypothetical protein
MTTFAHDLDQLIRRHLNSPRWGDDLQAICVALHEAADRWAMEADQFRLKDEGERKFERRQPTPTDAAVKAVRSPN